MEAFGGEEKKLENQALIEVCQEVLLELESSQDVKSKELVGELSQHLYIEDGRIVSSSVQASYLPQFIVSLMLSKGLKASLVKKALRKFYERGVAVLTI
ncbi:MAG: hypothetical protein D6699_04135 [Aquificota bacterium]|nr:MAG: hypothetical protein D6699_04135 [Aquificota bacterium]